MSVAAPTRSDRDIQTAVAAELDWTPDVQAASIQSGQPDAGQAQGLADKVGGRAPARAASA